jgi:transcription elongation GreA/GreB family factor
MSALDKHVLLKALIDRLNHELDRVKAQALDAAEGATHEDNRAEGDKDMRSTEASYIARGHAQRTAHLEQSITRLAHLDVGAFSDADEVKVTAVVELEHAKQRLMYFLVPVGGGERLTADAVTVQTITPSSPLGGALMGLSVGDEAEVESPQGMRVYEILSLR